jgi:hypothetical protein
VIPAYTASASALLAVFSTQPRFLAILMRWCSRHSRQTYPRTYARVVTCFRWSRRVAVKRSRTRCAMSHLFGGAPHLVRGEAEVTQYRPERPAGVQRFRKDPGEELPAMSFHGLRHCAASLMLASGG